MGITLYEHNQSAYDAALSMMRETGRAAVVHPTGTGKSFIGFKPAEAHPDARVCWVSPSRYIFATQLENLCGSGVENGPENITFLTYAKLMLLEQADLFALAPDYIILDEFHRCGATAWGAGVAPLLAAFSQAGAANRSFSIL